MNINKKVLIVDLPKKEILFDFSRMGLKGRYWETLFREGGISIGWKVNLGNKQNGAYVLFPKCLIKELILQLNKFYRIQK